MDFSGDAVSASVTGGKLVIKSLDASILKLSADGAAALNFANGASSTRVGDRLFFTTTSGAGNELWMVQNGTLVTRDIYAGALSSSPNNLTVIGDTLYFVATDATGRWLWQVKDGAAPAKLAAQTFTGVDQLINAGGQLAFVALPNGGGNDKQVYSYDPSGGMFTQLSSIAPSDSVGIPTGLTYANGKVFFAAQDHLSGNYAYGTGSGFAGRELWAATPGTAASAARIANIGQPDNDPFLFFGFFPIDGTVTSSNPQALAAAGGSVFFTANDGSSGNELWTSSGSGATRVADLVPGSGSSAISQLTAVQTASGPRMFFIANGSLWMRDVTSGTTDQVDSDGAVLGDGTANNQLLTAAGGKLYFQAGGKLWSTDGDTTLQFAEIIPPKAKLEVHVLPGEGDDQPSAEDLSAQSLLTKEVDIGSEPVPVDITAAVRAALARGDTRLTLRVENARGEVPVTLELAGPASSGKTGLEVKSATAGLVADLYAADGTVVKTGSPTLDIRAIEAGTYYLRVYDPTGASTQDVPFVIEVDAPIQGYTHPETDRDRIHGGDGDDLITGNQGLDRLWGDSGRDDFIGESLEIRDYDAPAGETLTLALSSERSTIPPEGPPVDSPIAIVDAGLRVAIAQSLGIPVTQSYIPGQYLIHVPDGSLRTDLAISDGLNFRERILASDLAELTVLDASGRGITTLAGLKYAINLTTLNLAGNLIGNGELDQLVPSTASSGDTRGFPTGMRELENLLLDFNPLTELAPLTFLDHLKRLSFDGASTAAILAEVPTLHWLEVGGVTRRLEFLSLDYVAPHGLSDLYNYYKIGKIFIDQDGPVDFSTLTSYYSDVYLDGNWVYSTNGSGVANHAVPIPLTHGWHNIELYYYGTAANLVYDTQYGPKEVVPESALLPFGAQEPIEDLSLLLGQDDLKFLSLKGNNIADIRPLTHLDGLEVVRLENNRISDVSDLLGEHIVDNGDAGFQVFGNWQSNLAPVAAAFEKDYVFRSGLSSSNSARWTFEDLEEGDYEILVTWPEGSSRSDSVTYEVRSKDTTAIVGGLTLFNSGLTLGAATFGVGGHTVTINTDTGEILGDGDGDAHKFYGTSYFAVGGDGLTTIFVEGDLNIPADTINVVGHNVLSIVVGNDVNMAPNAEFNLSAVGATAGAGGGTPGAGGAAGAGGSGGTYFFFGFPIGAFPGFGGGGGGGGSQGLFSSNPGSAGGQGGAGNSGAAGSTGAVGAAGQAGGGGYGNALGGGAGGAGGENFLYAYFLGQHYGGFGGAGGLGQPGGAGGGGGGSSGGNGGWGWWGSSRPGDAGAAGFNGLAGIGGHNDVTGEQISGGGAGGSGGGGSGAGGGGGGSSGSGGGGAGGGGGYPLYLGNGGNGGSGGAGGFGGLGGAGGSGGVGGIGGAGGGAMQLYAYGRVTLTNAEFNAQGGAGAAGTAGSAGQGGTAGSAGSSGQAGSGGSGFGGTGGTGGSGAAGGTGGSGGVGGAGGTGGGGAGGTIKVVGSVVNAFGTEIHAEGGTGGNTGALGRFVLGQNAGSFATQKLVGFSFNPFTGTFQLNYEPTINARGGAAELVDGPTGENLMIKPGIEAVRTPYIPGLDGGAAPFGLLQLDSQVLLNQAVFDAAALKGAPLAVVRVDGGISGLVDDFAGYDLLLFANLTDSQTFDDPMLGVGAQGFQHELMLGGWTRDGQFVMGTAPEILDHLNPGDVYAMLIPEDTSDFTVSASLGSGLEKVSFLASTETLNDGQVLFVRPPGGTATVNQQLAPARAEIGGTTWQQLQLHQGSGQTSLTVHVGASSPELVIQLSDASGGLVAADAVMLRKVGDILPHLRTLTLEGNPLDNRAHDIFLPAVQSNDVDVSFDADLAPEITPVANQPSTTAAAYDGNDMTVINASPSLAMTGSSTVEIRFQIASGDRSWTNLFHKSSGDGYSSRAYSVWVNQSNGQMFLSTADGSGEQYWYLPAGTVKPGEWYEFASVIDRGTGTVHAYLNGAEILSATIRTSPQAFTGTSLYLGNRSGGQGFTGVIDDLVIWSGVRSFAEVNEDFAAGVDDALVAGHWRFDGGALADDSSANHNTAYAGGASPVLGPIRVKVTDAAGDLIDLVPVFDDTQVNVSFDGVYLLVAPVGDFTGTAHVSLVARDGTGAPHDFRGRESETGFDITFGADAIYGNKFNDIDADGVRDAGERGLEGIQLFLDDNGNGALDTGEAVTWTDLNGDYAFRSLPYIAPQAFGPAVLVGSQDVLPNGGAGVTPTSQTTATNIVTRSEATFTFAAEQSNGALSFDGDDHVKVANSASLALTGSSTVEVRFKLDAAARDWTPIVLKSANGTTGTPRTYSMWVNRNSGQLFFSTQDVQGADHFWYSASTGMVQPEQWYEFATVIDRQTGKVAAYLNGAAVALDAPATISSAPAVATNTLYIGNGGLDAGLGLIGVIDDVAIWSTARTGTQIALDFANGIAGAQAGLAAHWSFNEPSGGTANDSSGNNNVGILGSGIASATPTHVLGDSGATGTLTASITLAPEATAGNRTLEDLRQDLNNALAQAKLGVISAQIVDGKIAFMLSPQSGYGTLEVKASTHTTVVETTVVDDVLLTNPRGDATTDGALEFAAVTQGVQDASGNLVAAALKPTTPDGGVVETMVAGNAQTETMSTTVVALDLYSGNLHATLTLTPEAVADNGSLAALLDELNTQIGGSALAGKVFASLAGDRIRFSTVATGSSVFLTVLGSTQTSAVATTTFGNGAQQVRQLPPTFQSQALGFDEDGATGTDRTYLVAEVPEMGWHPTTGTVIGTELVLGVLPVLFGGAGQIAQDVDFGNLIVVDLDMGPDLTVDEGDLVTLTPQISDPLERDDPFTYLWLVESDNGQVVGSGTEASFSFTPYDNGNYTLRLFVTDAERGFTAQPGVVHVAALNVVPAFEAGEDRALDEGGLLALNLPFTDPGTNDTHSALVAWGDGTSNLFESLEEVMGAGSITTGHAYADEGEYTVTVTLTDDDEASTVDSFTATVANVAPLVNAGPDRTVTEGQAVDLFHTEILHIFDIDFPIQVNDVTFRDGGTADTHTGTVDWGDGTGAQTITVNESPFGPPGSTSGLGGSLTGSHVYADNGTYTVTFTVLDDDGAVGADAFDITVLNAAPVVTPRGGQTGLEGQLIELGNVLFSDAGTLDTHSGTVDWGDGTGPVALVIDEVPSGPPGSTAGLTGQLHGSHVYADNGNYTVTFTLVDDDGGVATETLAMQILVDNVAPVVTAGTGDTINEGDTFSLSGAGFSDAGTADTHTAVVDWDDGSSSAGAVTESPFGPPGSTGGTTGTVDASHVFGDDGDYKVLVTVADDDGGVSSDSLIVTVLNVAPTVDAGEGQSVLEGDSVLVAAAFTDPGLLDSHSALIDWGDGTVTEGFVNAEARTVTGRHAYADNGAYQVAVTVNDGDGGVGSDTLTVEVGNAAPVVAAGGEASTDEGTLFVLPPTFFTDAGSADTHTATVDFGEGGAVAAEIDPSTGSISASHFYADNGAFTVLVTVTDDDGDSGTGSWVVTVKNVAPVAGDDRYGTTEDAPLTIGADLGVLANDTDVPGDTLQAVLEADVLHGTLTLHPDGSFSYVPVADFNGADTFSYRALDDDGGLSEVASVSIEVLAVNDAPTFARGADQTVFEDSGMQTVAGWASATSAGPTDEAGQFLNFLVETENAALFSAAPTISADGTLTYTPALNAFGSATVTVRLMDNGGTANGGDDTSDAQTFTITVTGVNDAPVPQDFSGATLEDHALQGQLVATDVDSDTLTFTRIGTGPTKGTLALNADGSFTYTPNADFFGTDAFIFRVSDGTVTSGPFVARITVIGVNDAPVAVDDVYQIFEDEPIDLRFLPEVGILANDIDVDGDAIFVAELLGGPEHGTLQLLGDGSFSYAPNADFAGSDSFTYRARDPFGVLSNAATVTFTVEDVNDAPVAGNTGYSTDEDQPLTQFLPVTDADAGDTFTITVLGGPQHGSLGINADGSFTYTPDADFFGADAFTYKANDGELDSHAATISITVNAVNDAPVAQDAALSTDEDSPLAITLAATDVDSAALTLSIVGGPQHGSLAFVGGAYVYTPHANFNGADSFTFRANDGALDSNAATVSITVNPVNDAPAASNASASTDEDTLLAGALLASDLEGDTLTFSLVGDATHGTVAVQADGSYSYTPDLNFNGTDSFTFRANDGALDSNAATVSITVNAVNDAPVASNASASTDEDTALGGTLDADDVEGDALTYSLVDATTHGLVEVLPGGSYSYTPAADFFGTDSFSFRANDGTLDSNVATVSITVNPVNDAPVAQDDEASTDEDTVVVIAVLPNDSDVDGDSLAVASVSAPSHGFVVLNEDGTLTYTPAANFFGSDSFRYRAGDGEVQSDEAIVTITVNPVNDAPVASAASVSTNEDTLLAGVLSASDVESDAVSFSLVGGAIHGTAAVQADGSFTYTPQADYYGADSFSFRVNDGSADSNVATVSIDVLPTPDAPVLADIGAKSVSEGATLSFAVLATDVDLPGDALSFSLIGGPGNASINTATGVFSWAPSEEQGPGTHEFTVRVADAFGLDDTASFSVTVDEDSSIDAGLQANDHADDTFRLFRDGANVKVALNGTVVFVRAAADVTGMTVTGSSDNDTLIVDLSGGDPLPAGGLAYDGRGPGDHDTLTLTGGTVGSLVYTPADAHSGTVSVDGKLITYAGLEPIVDNLVVANREFVFGSGNDTINVGVGGSRTTVVSPSSESVDFVNPTGTVTIHGGNGNDTIVVTGNPTYDLLIDAGGGNNTVTSSVPVGAIVTGTNGADDIDVGQAAGVLSIEVNGAASTLSGADRLIVSALGGPDTVTLHDLTIPATVDAGSGDDFVDASGVSAVGVVLHGGAGDDTLIGGAGDDMLFGGANDDVLTGNAGVDLLDGGEGNDTAVLQGIAPIAYWSLNETSGSTVADSAGAPQNGVFYGPDPDLDDQGPPASAAPFGAATGADFHDSNRDYIAVRHDAAFEVAQGTIQLWFKTRDANDNQTLFAKDRDGRNNGLRISLDDRDLRVELEDGATVRAIDTKGTSFNNLVSSNTWYQLTFTFGNGGMKLYLDGVLVGSNAYNGGLTGNREAIVIGGSNETNRDTSGNLSRLKITEPFDGVIDEVAFYGQALSAQQIAQTRQRGALGVIAPQDQSRRADRYRADQRCAGRPGLHRRRHARPRPTTSSVGSAWSEPWPDLAQLIAGLTHHGLRELLGDLREHGLKLFAHTSGAQALFSVDGVTLGEDGNVRHAGRHDASHEHGFADWTRDGGKRTGDAPHAKDKSEAHRQAEAKNADAKLIDWNGSFHGLGAGMALTQPGSKRGAQQPNLTDFDHRQKSDKNPRR